MKKSKSLSRTENKQFNNYNWANMKQDSSKYQTIQTQNSTSFSRKRYKSSSMLFRPSKYTRSIKKLQNDNIPEQPLKQLNRKQIISHQSMVKLDEVRKKLQNHPESKKLKLSQMNNVVSQQVTKQERKNSKKSDNKRKIQHIMNLSLFYKHGELAQASNNKINSLTNELNETTSLILNQDANFHKNVHKIEQMSSIDFNHIKPKYQNYKNEFHNNDWTTIGQNQNFQQKSRNKYHKKNQISVQQAKQSEISFILNDDNKNIEKKSKYKDFQSQPEAKYQIKIKQPKQAIHAQMMQVPQLSKDNVKIKNHEIKQDKSKNLEMKKKEKIYSDFDTIEYDLEEIVLTDQSKLSKMKNVEHSNKPVQKKSQMQQKHNNQQSIRKNSQEVTQSKNKFKTQTSQKQGSTQGKVTQINNLQKQKINQSKNASGTSKQQKKITSTYKENLREQIKRLYAKISTLTPLGQTAGICSQLLKKIQLNWYVPATLLYKQCYRQLKSVEQQFKEANRQGIVDNKQLQAFLSENEVMKQNLQRILRYAKKKGKISPEYQLLAQPQNETVLRKYIYREVLKFYEAFKSSQQKKNSALIQCTLRMLDSACILIRSDGKKSRSVKNIDQMTPQEMSKILPLLEQIIKDNV